MILLPVPINGRVYAVVFLFLFFTWPLIGLIDPYLATDGILIVVGLCVATVSSYVLTYVRCSSNVMSYWSGLCIVSGVWMTGIVNITLVIIFPLLFIFHSIAFLFALMSLIAGRKFAQRMLIQLSYVFSRCKLFDLSRALDAIDNAGHSNVF